MATKITKLQSALVDVEAKAHYSGRRRCAYCKMRVWSSNPLLFPDPTQADETITDRRIDLY